MSNPDPYSKALRSYWNKLKVEIHSNPDVWKNKESAQAQMREIYDSIESTGDDYDKAFKLAIEAFKQQSSPIMTSENRLIVLTPKKWEIQLAPGDEKRSGEVYTLVDIERCALAHIRNMS